ncbi:polysaccharide deacetylase family protein [Chryseobacterium sp. CBSDS_008]|uniref:polysaccharide deacetylase family protein n=1 Tax=Chryseobacterium sp. CBSDS_008 TaxID=3415265 RepID=UPI003CFACFDD
MVTSNYFSEILSDNLLQDWIGNIFRERFDVNVRVEFLEDHFCLTFSKENQFVTINFTNNGRHAFFSKENILSYISRESVSETIGLEIPNENLVLFGVSEIDWFIRKEKNVFTINYDFASYMIWALNRIEEYGVKSEDKHSRFELKDSHLFNDGLYLRPIVDEWICFIGNILLASDIDCRQNRFSYEVSHDVDKISRYISVPKTKFITLFLIDLVKRPKLAISYLTNRQYFFDLEVSNTFDWLMNISDKHGITSKFYFIPDSTSFKFDFRYNYTSFVKSLIKKIDDRGHEVGIHYSYNASSKFNIKAEWMKLREVFSELNIPTDLGGRMHYLRINFLETLRQLSIVGQKYDNTLTFHETGGFRCGTCFPYKPFDIYNKSVLNVEIRPLIVMEGSVLDYSKINIDDGKALQYVKKIVLQCYKVGGRFSLLWHNDEFESEKKKELYCEILEFCSTLKNTKQV